MNRRQFIILKDENLFSSGSITSKQRNDKAYNSLCLKTLAPALKRDYSQDNMQSD